jgi:2-methylisocitrate lyase-like PEP mutase family enzyme
VVASISLDFEHQRTLAERLRALHHGPLPLLLPNAWDAASALSFARARAKAIATTSAGIAAALGYPDRSVHHAAGDDRSGRTHRHGR